MPADPQRIVVLNGSLAGYVYALDAPVAATDTRVLGVTNIDGGFPPAWADEATAQGSTALPAGEQLDIEAVAAAEPDLIIGGGQGMTAVQAAEAFDRLSSIAPTVLAPATVVAWQEQLRLVADAVGRADRADALVRAYDERVARVREAITPPAEPVVFLLTVASGTPFLVPPAAALPALTRELGFTPDDVVAKAGDPPLYGSGDSFEVSPELLSRAVASVRSSPGERTAPSRAWCDPTRCSLHEGRAPRCDERHFRRLGADERAVGRIASVTGLGDRLLVASRAQGAGALACPRSLPQGRPRTMRGATRRPMSALGGSRQRSPR